MKLDHIGWVTNNLERFEEFWVTGIGFRKVWEAEILPEKVRSLYGTNRKVKAYKYQLEDLYIEIHIFDPFTEIKNMNFDKFGINHISLKVSSRDRFIQELKEKIGEFDVLRFKDPAGWYNIFIRDFDGNWIELREDL